MARKYGKPVEINLNPLTYNIGLLGESGIGKSTLIKEVCEKLVGKDGYLAMDVGREDGHSAINGIISEKVEDWSKYEEIVNDIIDNKDTDYKDLKVIIIDTYDEFCRLAENEAIRQYNIKNISKDKNKKAETINQAYGGYGKGLDKTIDLMLDSLWQLKQVGVSFIIIFHVKKKDIDDVMTEEQYSILTSNTTQRYFNAIKTKLHFLGLAYIDRDIVKYKTGKKDSKTNEDIERGKIVSESRVINFRDDTYSVDSKSRFADIVDKISFDADEFIQAMQDAILKEHAKSGVPIEESKKKQAKEAKAKEKAGLEKIRQEKTNADLEESREKYIETITSKFSKADDEIKKQAKKLLADSGCKKFTDAELSIEVLGEIAGLFE